jgi:hypothetical protein
MVTTCFTVENGQLRKSDVILRRKNSIYYVVTESGSNISGIRYYTNDTMYINCQLSDSTRLCIVEMVRSNICAHGVATKNPTKLLSISMPNIDLCDLMTEIMELCERIKNEQGIDDLMIDYHEKAIIYAERLYRMMQEIYVKSLECQKEISFNGLAKSAVVDPGSDI